MADACDTLIQWSESTRGQLMLEQRAALNALTLDEAVARLAASINASIKKEDLQADSIADCTHVPIACPDPELTDIADLQQKSRGLESQSLERSEQSIVAARNVDHSSGRRLAVPSTMAVAGPRAAHNPPDAQLWPWFVPMPVSLRYRKPLPGNSRGSIAQARTGSKQGRGGEGFGFACRRCEGSIKESGNRQGSGKRHITGLMKARPIHIDMNRLLASLPIAVRKSLMERFEKVRLEACEILHDVDQPAEYVWFILSGIVSLQIVTRTDYITEVAIIGSNGAVGVHLIARSNVSYRAQVYVEGEALRIRIRDLRKAIRQNSILRDVLLDFLVSLTEQIARTASRIQHYELQGWLADRLLLMQTLLSSDSFDTTHEYIANFIGVPRTDVTEAIGALRDAGAIYNSRGYIEILNTNKLKSAAGGFFDKEMNLPERSELD